MTESNNIFNRPFGLNIRLPERTIQQVQETAVKNANLFAPMNDYLSENDKVFNGDVAKEINRYNSMIYAMGSAAREGKPIKTFDTRG